MKFSGVTPPFLEIFLRSSSSWSTYLISHLTFNHSILTPKLIYLTNSMSEIFRSFSMRFHSTLSLFEKLQLKNALIYALCCVKSIDVFMLVEKMVNKHWLQLFVEIFGGILEIWILIKFSINLNFFISSIFCKNH